MKWYFRLWSFKLLVYRSCWFQFKYSQLPPHHTEKLPGLQQQLLWLCAPDETLGVWWVRNHGQFSGVFFDEEMIFVRKTIGKNTLYIIMPVWLQEPSCFKVFWNRFLKHVSSCVRILQYLFLWLYRIQFPGQECFRGSSRLSGALTWVGHGRRCNHGGSSEVLAPPTGNIIAVDELTCCMKGRDENQVTLMNGWYPGWWNKPSSYPGLSRAIQLIFSIIS